MRHSSEALQLMADLERLGQTANNRFPDLNRGGCCVFASLVARRLQRRNVKVGVITTCDSRTPSIDVVRERLIASNVDLNAPGNWSENGISFYHMGVMMWLDNVPYTYDSDVLLQSHKKFGADSFRVHLGMYTVKEAEALARHSSFWSQVFDRSEIPALKRLVSEVLT